jgi:hypothetical protein
MIAPISTANPAAAISAAFQVPKRFEPLPDPDRQDQQHDRGHHHDQVELATLADGLGMTDGRRVGRVLDERHQVQGHEPAAGDQQGQRPGPYVAHPAQV